MSLLVGTTAGAYRVDGSVETVIEATRVNHIARHDDMWWAVDGKGRIHHDGEVVASLPEGLTPLCIQPTPDTVWIGTTGAHLYGLDRGELIEDEFFANAPGRRSWYTPWGAPPDIRSMTLDASHTLYINVHVGGILRYDDAGPVPTLDIDADAHQVTAHPSIKEAIFAATANGLAVSGNGHEFDFRTDGLHASYCRAVTVLENRVLVSASTGPRSERGRLYAGLLFDGPLEPVTKGLPEWFEGNLDTHCLISRDGSVYAGFGDTIWESTDRGETWSTYHEGLPTITCLG